MFKCLYPGQKSLLAISFPFTVKVCSLNYSLKNFQGFSSTVQLSRFALLVLSRTSLNILAHQLSNVKHFFTFYFDIFLLSSSERRRRDLNPRAAVNDLLPFQGSPFGQLGYFSKMPGSKTRYYILMKLVLSSTVAINGEGGIRTHAPFRTNGFQDRLVMTTSIPLHSLTRSTPQRGDELYSSIFDLGCQPLFSSFLSKISTRCEAAAIH